MLEAKDYTNLSLLNHNWLDAIGSDIIFMYKDYFEYTSNAQMK